MQMLTNEGHPGGEGQPEGQPNELESFLTAHGLGYKILVACEKADYNL